MAKRLFFIILLGALSFCSSGQPKWDINKNDWAEFKTVGLFVDARQLVWAINVNLENAGIKRIDMLEMLSKDQTRGVAYWENISKAGNQFLKTRPLSKDDAAWLLNSGPTLMAFRFILTDAAGQQKPIVVPVAFKEESKQNLRKLLVADNPDYILESKQFDNRTWILAARSRNAQTYLKEFTDQKENDIYKWKELISYTEIGQKMPMLTLVNLFANGLKGKCPNTVFEYKEMEKSIIYFWNHNGCGNNPAQGEIARIVEQENTLLVIHYAYKDTLSEENFSKWYKILQEIH